MSLAMAKSRKDRHQAGLLIEAMSLASVSMEIGMVWIEAWDRGPKWQECLSRGSEGLTAGQKEMLVNAVRETARQMGLNSADYGFSDATTSLHL